MNDSIHDVSTSLHEYDQDDPLKDETVRANQSPLAFNDGTHTSNHTLTPHLFERFKEKVFDARPNFRTINETAGEIMFYDYHRRQIRDNRNKTIKKRKPEFINIVSDETRRLLGSAIADGVARQLKDNNTLSTIQHSAPLSHPYVLSSTLQNSLSLFGMNQPFLQNAIVLSCANISFNNYKFPRGHLLHTFKNGNSKTHSLTLFGHTADSRPVMHHPPYHHTAIKDIRNRIITIKNDGDLSNEKTEQLLHFFESIYSSPHALSTDNYHDQLSITNYLIFKELFKNYSKNVPNLIFISQETIALRLLLDYHLNQETIINRILFDPSLFELILKYFDGLNGAFSTEKNYGTFFFWGLPPESKHRIQLWKKGKFLMSFDESFKVELTSDAIAESIRKNELIPNTLLTFIVVAFYYGQYLGGGPAQTLNLTLMKEAYLSLLDEIGDTENYEGTKEIVTTNLVISRPTLAFIDVPSQDKRIPATGLDLLLYSDHGKTWDKTIEATKNTKLSEIFNRALPSFYAEFVPQDEKEERMNTITERDIEKLTGLDKKIPPLITIP